jgi:hypothetical protein
MNKLDWFPDWDGECVAIVAAGPSVKQADVDKLRDRIHVVAINESYKLCKWADMLYACDDKWWNLHRGAKDFRGLRVTQNDEAVRNYPELKKVKIRRSGPKDQIIHDFLMDEPGEIGGGGHSGFQAMNLVAQFGATAIMLLGFDMCYLNGQVHWHGRHPPPVENPIEENFRRWIAKTDKAKESLDALGIDVVNCSPISLLTKYPKISVDDALKRWGL